MPRRRFRLRAADDHTPAPIRDAVAQLRQRVGVPDDFPEAVATEAAMSATAGPGLPPGGREWIDRTDVEFVTIDPPGSMDLDQALHLERRGDGYRVHYAIADVAAWVRPGGRIDVETHRRGQTFYAPASRTPLHPPVLSEQAASLLADGTARPALLWTIDLDAEGRQQDVEVVRAMVRSRARLDYDGVQKDLNTGTASESLQLLRTVGQLRQRVEADRGGVSLNLPDQEVVVGADGSWRLHLRTPLPVEDWNAQISLLTGMAAAGLMVDAGVGLLRTLPPASPQTVDALRRIASTLGIAWAPGDGYAAMVRTLDPAVPAQRAMMMACVLLFRGAAYTVVTPGLTGDGLVHGALASTYAHTTAPLRRLVDRYVGETCLAICAGLEVPEWVSAALPDLPATMKSSDSRAKAFERGVIDLVEALVLSDEIGQQFDAVVVQAAPDGTSGTIVIDDVAVEAPVRGTGIALGQRRRVMLVSDDPAQGKVAFRAV